MLKKILPVVNAPTYSEYNVVLHIMYIKKLMQYVEKFFVIIFFNQMIKHVKSKIHLVNGLCGYTNIFST